MKEIATKQVLARMAIENPWCELPHMVPEQIQKMTPRAYLDLFYPLLKDRSIKRAIVLMGPRRVGKTVLIHHAIKRLIDEGVKPSSICYFSVDHPLYNGLDLEQMLSLCSKQRKIDFIKNDCYVFFDEIQYLKGWELYLKAIVDRYPNIKCVASGSAAAALRLKSTESGAGRFTEFLLPPLTFYEYMLLLKEDKLVSILERKSSSHPRPKLLESQLHLLNKKFLHYINYGGYPEVILSEAIQSDPARFIKSDIIDKVLLRDLPSLYGISDIQELNHLFTTLAFNTANEISLDPLAVKSGLAKNTIKRYIQYLEAAFLIKTINRVDVNARRFKRANFFKVYLTNPSIRSALFSPIDERDASMGALVETAIFSQWFHSDMTLHYARWNSGEIDIVDLDLQNQKPKWLVEVKWSDAPFNSKDKVRNVVKFCHLHNLQNALVTTRSVSGRKSVESVDIEFLPSSVYCYIVGRNLVKGKHLQTRFEKQMKVADTTTKSPNKRKDKIKDIK